MLTIILSCTNILFFAWYQEQKGFKEMHEQKHVDELWRLREQLCELEEEWLERVSLWRNKCPEFHSYLRDTDYDEVYGNFCFMTDAEKERAEQSRRDRGVFRQRKLL